MCNSDEDKRKPGPAGFRGCRTIYNILSSATVEFTHILWESLGPALKGFIFSGNCVPFSNFIKLIRTLQGGSGYTWPYQEAQLEVTYNKSVLLLISGCKLGVIQTK